MIPVFDYLRGHARIREEVETAIGRVLASGKLILGPEGEALEAEFARYVGVDFAVGVGSGTDALVVALRALGIGPGDEAITVGHTAAATVQAIGEVGAAPRLVDVDDRSLLIDPQHAAAAIGPRTRAIVPVHLYGHPAAMPAILALASRHGLAVVEDCAQAHGARIARRHVGSFGTIGCFSFYPTKNLGAYGDGGMCVTDDPMLAERMRRLRFHGFDAARVAQLAGINSRLDEVQAAVLRVKLRHLDGWLAARRAHARHYLEELEGAPLRLPPTAAGTEPAWHLFVVRLEQRARIIESLTRAGIGCAVHYPQPVHRMPAYDRLGCGPGSLPVTERAAREVLSLPMFPELEPGEVEAVCRALRGALDPI
jgi:dTDP-4-amino-4,6-dideoxygalactose transaminase